MTDNNLSKLLDKGLINVKKRKTSTKKSLSAEKYNEFLKSSKKKPTSIQKIMKKNIKTTIKQNDQLNKKSNNIKKLKVVEKPIYPVFKINRKENAIKQKKTKIKNKKSRSKRKPRKVSFTVKKTRAKKINIKNKKSDEMLNELKNKGITVSGKSDRLVRDIYMCIMNDNIEIKKE
tara:strand:- start:42 stop:566 length:525 start_codon:yes stop_codon:yes gene_type:complete